MLSTELTKLTFWHARPEILKGAYSESLCPIIDKGETVTGTMIGVHWHEDQSRTYQQRSVVAHSESLKMLVWRQQPWLAIYQQLPRQLAEASGAATPGIVALRPLGALLQPTLI